MASYENPYTEEEIAIIREMWLQGHNDGAIGARLNRPRKSISGKRRKIKLTVKFYPDRHKLPHHCSVAGRRTYSKADEADILRRVSNGERISDIALIYEVSDSAMRDKVERLNERGPVREMTGRYCLCCGRWFLSPEPKRINRRCAHCNEERDTDGATFLTVYAATVLW